MSDEEHPSSPSDFDADALAALARPSAAPPAMDDDDGDGGVLDLRALAASAVPPAPDVDQEPAESAADEGVPVAQSKASVQAATASAPAAALAAQRPAAEKKGASGVVIGVVIGLAAAAALFVFMRGPSQPDPVVRAANAPGSVPALVPPMHHSAASTSGAPVPGPLSGAAQPGAVAGPDTEAGGEPDPDAAPGVATATHGVSAERRHHAARHPNQAEHEDSVLADTHAEETHEDAPAAAPPSMASMQAESEHGADDRSMDQLLNSALGGEPVQGGTMTAPVSSAMVAAPAADANLPESPSRSVVTRVLGGLMGQMRSCAGDQVGMANARIRISNDGTVASVAIAGAPFGGTPQGSCMENVVRRAHFPRFSRPTIDLTFPFSIRPLN